MRIAFIVTAFPTLSYTFILDKITGLIDRGHQVDIFADRPGNLRKMHADVEKYRLLDRTYYPAMPRSLILRYLKGIGLFLLNVWKHPRVMLRSLNVFKYGELAASLVLLYGSLPLLKKRAYDVIHCQFGPNGLKGLFFVENKLIVGKLITHFYGYDVNVYPRRRGNDVYRRLFERGDFHTANSKFLVSRALALGCPANRIVELSIGVDLSRFFFRERDPRSESGVRILTVAGLVEVKGIEYAIHAIAEVAKKYPDVRYLIAGDGPLRGDLERLASELGIGHCVDFLGGCTQDQILELYAKAHIFILPGIVGRDGAEEGQGTVLAEAQATGLPVVSTHVGGIPESVVADGSAFLVPPRDVEALRDRLCHLIEHPEVWAEMGRCGRKHVEQNYDVEKLNDRLVQFYEDVLEGRLP